MKNTTDLHLGISLLVRSNHLFIELLGSRWSEGDCIHVDFLNDFIDCKSVGFSRMNAMEKRDKLVDVLTEYVNGFNCTRKDIEDLINVYLEEVFETVCEDKTLYVISGRILALFNDLDGGSQALLSEIQGEFKQFEEMVLACEKGFVPGEYQHNDEGEWEEEKESEAGDESLEGIPEEEEEKVSGIEGNGQKKKSKKRKGDLVVEDDGMDLPEKENAKIEEPEEDEDGFVTMDFKKPKQKKN